MDFPYDWIATHGYAALFVLLALGIVGLLVPDEALLLFARYLCFTGEFQVAPAALAVFLGTTCGITISYGLGRVIGPGVATRLGLLLHLDVHQVTYAQTWIQRWGPYAVLVGYFLPGIRHMTTLLIRASTLPISRFTRFAYPGALLWCSTFIGIGYALGAEWSQLSPSIHRSVVLVALFMMAAIVLGFVLGGGQHRHTRPPQM